MTFLLDTNVISELHKRKRPNPAVRRWWQSTPRDQMYLSVLVLGEIRGGIERLRRRDPAQAAVLEVWHASLQTEYRGRILIVDAAISDRWGRLAATRPLPLIDALLAATALVHDLTRNTKDIASTGVRLLDPFADA